MPETYYQSAHTGEQIDNAISRIASGEFDKLAEDAVAAGVSAQSSMIAAENAKIAAEAEVVKAKASEERAAKEAEDAEESAAAAAISEAKAKLYADQTEASVSGVASFNGRGGHVMPQTGDYTADMVGAAPAGFGLGASAKLLTSDDDLNTLFAGGWYRYERESLPKNIPNPGSSSYFGAYALVHVLPFRSGFCVQTVYNMSHVTKDNIVIMRTIDGTVGEWEWVNPLLSTSGVEYRTTERYMGKPVYVKAVSVGDLEANVSKQYVVDSGVYDAVVRTYAHGTNLYNRYCTPNDADGVIFQCSGMAYKVYSGGSLSLRLFLNSNVAMSNVTAVVYYTKFTD